MYSVSGIPMVGCRNKTLKIDAPQGGIISASRSAQFSKMGGYLKLSERRLYDVCLTIRYRHRLTSDLPNQPSIKLTFHLRQPTKSMSLGIERSPIQWTGKSSRL